MYTRSDYLILETLKKQKKNLYFYFRMSLKWGVCVCVCIFSYLKNSIGPVHSVRVLQARRCAFVNYFYKEDCDKAINDMHVSIY